MENLKALQHPRVMQSYGVVHPQLLGRNALVLLYGMHSHASIQLARPWERAERKPRQRTVRIVWPHHLDCNIKCQNARYVISRCSGLQARPGCRTGVL